MSNAAKVPGLSEAERERLALLVEELGEAQQAVGKILRHGFESCHPSDPSITNRDYLERELGDVLASIKLLSSASDVSFTRLYQNRDRKLEVIGQWLHHQGAVQ